jgi:hypothetical protein
MRKLSLSLLFALTACGSVEHFDDANNGTIDGPASPDAEATVGTANVTTYNITGPHTVVGGIDIIVTATDGTQRDLQITDGSGSATVDVHTGDSITAVYKNVGRSSVVTYAAVKPNDHITFGQLSSNGGQNQTGVQTANFTNIGANYYYAYAACTNAYADSTQSSFTLYYYDNCPASTPVYLLAYDANSNLIDWAKLPNNNTQATTTTNAPAWQSAVGFTMSATGVPAEVTQVQMQVQDQLGQNGYSVSTQYSGVPTGGSLSSTVGFIGGGDPLTSLVVYFRDNVTGVQGEFNVLPANSVQFGVVNPTLLPWMGQLAFDPSSEALSVPIESGASYDATLFDISWTRYPSDGGTEYYDWLVVAPPGSADFTLPALGGNDAVVMPQTTDSINYNNQAIIIDYSDATSYDAVRAKPEWEALPFGTPTSEVKLSVSSSPPSFRVTDRPLFSFPPAAKLVR